MEHGEQVDEPSPPGKKESENLDFGQEDGNANKEHCPSLKIMQEAFGDKDPRILVEQAN